MIEQYPSAYFDIMTVQKAKQGKTCCGDSYYINEADDFLICALADGLGSGKGAQAASMAAIETVAEYHDQPLDEMMKKVNESQAHLRGCVLTIIKIDFKSQILYFSGIGNITTKVHQPGEKALYPIPERGILTGRPVKPEVKTFNFPANASFVMHSDGIKETGNPERIFKSYIWDGNELQSANQLIKENGDNDDLTFILGRPKSNY